jgi:hypothetical protein
MTDRPSAERRCIVSEHQQGLRLGVEQERRLRAWPKDRIRPKSVALGVISLLAEVDALTDERDTARAELAQAEAERAALRQACLTPSGLGCRLCHSTWLRGEDDHYRDCALAAHPQAAEPDQGGGR